MADALRRLVETRAAHVLILAALDGVITDFACEMPECRCPKGRGYFEPRKGYNHWAPSADRYPVPGRDGGEYVVDNVRLAHFRCNQVDGGKYGGRVGGAMQAERFAANPAIGLANAARMNRWLAEHPEAMQARRERLATWIAEHPEERAAALRKAAATKRAKRIA